MNLCHINNYDLFIQPQLSLLFLLSSSDIGNYLFSSLFFFSSLLFLFASLFLSVYNLYRTVTHQGLNDFLPISLSLCLMGVLKEGGSPNPISQQIHLFFSNPSSNPTIQACVAQIEIPFPFFYCFCFMNPSPSAQNLLSQPLKKANPNSCVIPSGPSLVIRLSG